MDVPIFPQICKIWSKYSSAFPKLLVTNDGHSQRLHPWQLLIFLFLSDVLWYSAVLVSHKNGNHWAAEIAAIIAYVSGGTIYYTCDPIGTLFHNIYEHHGENMAGSNQGGRAINQSDKGKLFEELGSRCYPFPILNHLERTTCILA